MKRLIFLLSFALMGSSLPTLKFRAQDNAGLPLSGAKLYFYTHGTTTPKATYSNEGLTSANANPVVADSAGWFGEIYLSTDDAYRVVLKTSAGVTVWTLDNINASQLTSAGFLTRVKQIASNPLDYGAVGDGVADESSFVQSAINNATGTVDLLGKTYRCDTTITMRSDLTLKNGTLDFSSSASNAYIYIAGSVALPVLLDADAAAGDGVISPTSAATFAAGDLVYVESAESWAGAAPTYGEMFVVDSIAGGDLYVDDVLLNALHFATALGVYKITPMQRVELSDLNIVAAPASAGLGHAIMATYAKDITLRNVRVSGARGASLLLSYSSGISVQEMFSESSSATSYGVLAMDGTRDLSVVRSTFTGLGYGVRLYVDSAGNDGLIRRTAINNNVFRSVLNPVLAAVQAYDVRVDGNNVSGASAACISVTSLKASVSDNVIGPCTTYGVALSATGSATDPAVSIEAVDNNVSAVVVGIYSVLNTGTTTRVAFKDNVVRAASSYGVSVTGSSAVGEVVISGNHLSSANSGVYVTTAANKLSDLLIANNAVSSVTGGSSSVYIAGTFSRARVADNALTRNDDSACGLTIAGNSAGAAEGLVISGNTITNGSYGVCIANVSTTRPALLHGNSFSSIATRDVSAIAGQVFTSFAPEVTGVTTVAVPDSGGAGAATYTLEPHTSTYALSCLDADGCTITMSETLALSGQNLLIYVSGSYPLTFSESAGLLTLVGGSSYAMVAGDALRLVYLGDQWSEASRSRESGVSADDFIQHITIPSDGTGAAGGLVTTLTARAVEVTCNDPDNCVIFITGGTTYDGRLAVVCGVQTGGSAAYTTTFADGGTSGAVNVGAARALGNQDCLALRNQDGTWLETGFSDN